MWRGNGWVVERVVGKADKTAAEKGNGWVAAKDLHWAGVMAGESASSRAAEKVELMVVEKAG